VPLKADLSHLDENTRRMIAKLVQAADVMNDLAWKQTWNGDAPHCSRRRPTMPRANW
jgi:hypothetical protein